VDGSAVVARSEASEVLEAIKASLDAIAVFVGFYVMRDSDLSGAV